MQTLNQVISEAVRNWLKIARDQGFIYIVYEEPDGDFAIDGHVYAHNKDYGPGCKRIGLIDYIEQEVRKAVSSTPDLLVSSSNPANKPESTP